ncbi:winged helix-turn-helix domain-containing protein [Dactylosporangium vinaceum]|uniref:BTAD domain-containing putative transcriptional regulator n=1 Tax=Dactylosporangium vinaceum TaxID=53362 RepID=A0ABV5M9C4_9ACTN|nr:AfsR/SARP family transcriptional regulator [Dactylosporangium vinaceum]UAB99981.1 winged helix-turn-helix domain-containing protein [Dactylosporangium vinaceum]
MRFQLLGPVRIEVRGADLLVTSRPIQRSLAAALMLRAGEPVPVDDLIDWLWGDAPPRTSRNVLQFHVSRLRSALAAEGEAGRLVTLHSAYRLDVHPDELDLMQFRRLHKQARRLIGAADHAGGASVLATALALWRGTPLGQCSLARIGHGEVTALLEERLGAVEERITAELASGPAARLVGELRALSAAHPLRERLHELLMLALHGSGRQAEALAVFADVRRLLIDQLGIEPGPGLVAAHRTVLAGLPADDGATDPAAPPAELIRPAELPRDTPMFHGRAFELWQLVSMLRTDGGPAVIAVDGPAGVGKSALALHAAHAVQDQFPDGQLYVDLRHASAGSGPGGIAGQLLRGLGVTVGEIPADPAEAAARLRSLVASRWLLILLDNVPLGARLDGVLPGRGPAVAMLTGRGAVGPRHGVQRLMLDPLPASAATAMLAALTGPGRVTAEPQAARTIVEHCEGLPLAIQIVGARIARQRFASLESFAERLADPQRRLDTLRDGDLSMRGSLMLSYDRLGELDRTGATAALLHRLATGDVREYEAGRISAAGWRVDDVETQLQHLCDERLLRQVDAHSYRMPELVRLFVGELARVVRVAEPSQWCAQSA